MKAVSQVVGVVIALALLVPVILGFLSLERSYQKQYFMVMRSYREKLDLIPLVNQSGIYISIVNPGPIEPVIVKYLILKNISNGKILSIRELNKKLDVGDSVDVILFNTTSIRGKIDVIAVTLDGGVLHLDPIFVGNDGVLDENDVRQIMQGGAGQNGFFINPVIGWAFNKSIVALMNGKVYYLVPHRVRLDWSTPKIWFGDVYPGVWCTETLYDEDVGKYVEKIRFSSDEKIVIYYTDGSSRTLRYTVDNGEQVYRTNIWAKFVYTVNYTDLDFEVDLYYNVSELGFSSSDTAFIRFQFYYDLIVHFKNYVPNNVSVYSAIRISDNNYDKVDACEIAENKVVNIVGDTIKVRSDVRMSPRFYYGPGITMEYGTVKWRLDRLQFIIVEYGYDPVLKSFETPYSSYDVYDPHMQDLMPTGVGFTRMGSWDTEFGHDTWLLPGNNYLNVRALMPELYVINISQGQEELPPYLLLYTSNPTSIAEILNVTGGDNSSVLLDYGLLDDSSTIVFKYKSAVSYAGSKKYYIHSEGWEDYMKYSGWFTIYNSGTSIANPSKSMIIIPLEGPYKGRIFYLWVSSWKLLKQ